MGDEIKPALTPEEWAEWIANGNHHATATIEKRATGPRLYVGTSPLDRPEEFAAIAALCLHGQPFGFTWDDVRRLRDYPDLYGGLHGSATEASWDAFMADLANRIAALLPPRQENG